MPTAALQVVNLHVHCSRVQTLNGISLYAMPGETVVLLGRNGSGRRATLRAIINQPETRHTQVTDQDTRHNGSNKISSLGMQMLRAEDGVVSNLTCEENLLLSSTSGNSLGGAMSLTQIYELCPDLDALKHTPATRLSGAEKRMLAIARMLRTGANVLLMDNVSQGLAPAMTRVFSEMLLNLKKHGYTIIMGARDLDFCAPLADRFYVIENGQITDTFGIDELGMRSTQLHKLMNGTRH